MWLEVAWILVDPTICWEQGGCSRAFQRLCPCSCYSVATIGTELIYQTTCARVCAIHPKKRPLSQPPNPHVSLFVIIVGQSNRRKSREGSGKYRELNCTSCAGERHFLFPCFAVSELLLGHSSEGEMVEKRRKRAPGVQKTRERNMTFLR